MKTKLVPNRSRRKTRAEITITAGGKHALPAPFDDIFLAPNLDVRLTDECGTVVIQLISAGSGTRIKARFRSLPVWTVETETDTGIDFYRIKVRMCDQSLLEFRIRLDVVQALNVPGR